MNPNDYQNLALQTAQDIPDFTDQTAALVYGALGLAGEAGEVVELIKKSTAHGHPLDLAKVLLELGDTLWYITYLTELLGYTLDDVLTANILKLRERYAGTTNRRES